MRKIFLMILLTVISNSAIAEWTAINRNSVGETDESTVYVNFDSIRINGSYAKMWALDDYKLMQTDQETGERYLSSLTQYEYDCKEEQFRILALIWYYEHMGNGQTVYSYYSSPQRKWKPVTPESIGEHKFKIACGSAK